MKRVGIVGFGPMGERHARAVVGMRGFQLVGVTDLRTDVEGALEALSPETPFADSIQELLALRPEILVVSTNGPSHYPSFLEGIGAGVRRFVIEKPLCVSVSQARDMIRIASETASRVVVNLTRRYSSFYRGLPARLPEVIGEPAAFHAPLGSSGLACNGTHLLDLGLMLLGRKPRSVVGFLDDRGLSNPRGPAFHDPGGFGIVLLEDGKRIVLDMGEDFGVQGKYQLLGRFGRLVIDEIGRQAVAEGRDAEGRSQPLSRIGCPLRVHPIDSPGLDVVDLARRAIEDAAGEGPVTCGLEHGLDALKLVIAFHLSHRRGNTPIRWADIEPLSGDESYSFT